MARSGSASIAVDVFERRSGVPERLLALGVAVDFAALSVGDYAVDRELVIERKTVLDLHSSLVRARFWAQIGGLRETCRYPHLIVEGRSLDAGPISREAVRSTCLAAMRLGVRLLRTIDAEDSALWISRLAVHASGSARPRPIYAQRRKPRDRREAAEAMLAAVPGVSTATARALLARFGSISAILQASEAELRDVRGVGTRRARTLETVVSTAVDCPAMDSHS